MRDEDYTEIDGIMELSESAAELELAAYAHDLAREIVRGL